VFLDVNETANLCEILLNRERIDTETQRKKTTVANWSDFRIRISGPSVGQRHVVGLLERCQERIDDQHTPWVFDLCALVHRENERQVFWSPEPWHAWQDDSLVIRGQMKWTPPLAIVETLAQMFTELTFDVISTTEHERCEHWRTTSGQPPRLIEEQIVDLRQDSLVSHWIREGEDSVFAPVAGQRDAGS